MSILFDLLVKFDSKMKPENKNFFLLLDSLSSDGRPDCIFSLKLQGSSNFLLIPHSKYRQLMLV